MKVMTFPSIPLLPKASDVFRALGYSKDKTILAGLMEKDLNCYMEEARNYIILKGAAARLSIKEIKNGRIVLENDIIFNSKDLVNFLKGAKETLFIAATAGQAVMDAITAKTSEKDLTRAVVYNAVAGEMVDEALTWIGQYMHQQLLREGASLDLRRFSVGYGDFKIENQKIFWKTLNLKDLGIFMTDQYFLLPEKSVTAISGIRFAG